METEDDSNDAIEITSDSEDSSVDDKEEEINLARVEELEKQVADNKYLYDAHLELVNLYRTLGDLKSMRLAYERFSELFPLTPEIWLAWINDEKKVASTEAEKKNIFALFDKAVDDYLSVDLWVEYAQYSIGASDLETTRAILERGLTAAGLHTADGGLLWDTLRELEYAHLSLTQENEAKKAQIAKITENFRRQLSVPLMDMENTYKEWKDFLTDHPDIDPQPIEWGYQKALKTLETYKPFELQLVAEAPPEELQKIFQDYIKIVKDPSTTLTLYERAVARLCLNTHLWLDYCFYGLKLGEIGEKITSKALRNCPWSEEIWCLKIRVLEHLKKDPGVVLACFEQAVGSIGSDNGIDLWLTYLEYFNRTSEDKEKIYKLFEQAMEQLKYKGGELKIARFYSRILGQNKKLLEARKVWKEIFKNPQNKNSSSLWLEFANFEKIYGGDPGQIRSVYQRGLNSDWPQGVAEEWLFYERQYGDFGDTLKCLEKCRDLLTNQVYQQPIKEMTEKKRKLDDDKVSNSKKQKLSPEDKTKIPKVKGFETKKVRVEKDPNKTVFISNLFPSITEKQLKKFFPDATNIELVTDRQGKSRCYGYVQFSMPEEVSHALARDREILDNRPIFISNCKPDRNERKAAFKYSSTVESNKLFIRGLPVDKTQQDLEEIYRPLGATSVRLVLHKSGQPKGLAYVEFPDEEKTKEALKKTDQMKIGSHTITVAVSAPPPKTGVKAAPPPVRSHARSRLQVPMIPRSLQVGNKNGEEKEGKAGPAKSNEDFRKMFFNK